MKKTNKRKDRHQADGLAQLKAKYELLKELMDQIPDVIYFKDRKGRLVMVNKAYARGLGLSPDEVIGKTDFDIFPRERAKKMVEDDWQVMVTGQTIVDKLERATRPDGVDNYVSTTKIPRYDKNGRISGLIGITRDITHRMQVKQLEEEKEKTKKELDVLQEINRLKSEFISIVSHELRTPLAIIKDTLGVVSDGLAGDVSDKQKELLQKGDTHIVRLQHLIDGLLDISRIETGRLKLHYSLINLNELIIDSADFFKKLAQERGISLKYHLPSQEINIFVDAERIIQIANNLLNNAIKFTEDGGKIALELKALQDKVRIGVIDTGVGISRQDLPKIFDKFTQFSKNSGMERKGVGLGLSIARGLVEKHGGEIWAESKLGVGTKIYFTLPRFYSINILNKNIRDEINNLVGTGKTVYLISLSIVNYAEIKVKIPSKKLSVDLRNIIEYVFNSVIGHSSENFEILCIDAKRGECSVILPGATEERANKVCSLLKERIENYFRESNIRNIFINIGRLPYFLKKRIKDFPLALGNFYIKRIYIGLNKRGAKRVSYRVEIGVLSASDEAASAHTVDISHGGICFVCNKLLEANKQVTIDLRLPNRKVPLAIKGRVAWVSPIEEAKGEVHKYKVGVEFIDLKRKERNVFKESFKRLNM
ncbi:MAG: ATP-binding protein [Candidatus Omnitrophota bacterium]